MNAQVSSLKSTGDDQDDRPVLLPINAVERESGVSKELLRMWERRYGFPSPSRDAQGDRIYPMEQVAKLRLLRRLIDYGFRPGKIIAQEASELERLLRSQGKAHHDSSPELEKELLSALKSPDSNQVKEYLTHQMTKVGLQSFVLEFLQHANFIVGDAWMRGMVEVHEEHLFTEEVKAVVRHAIGTLSETKLAPRVLLATPPQEMHTLGLLMAEAILRLENADAVCYGAEMPVHEVVQAVNKHKINIVAMSFSASYPTSKAIEYLEEVRFRLPLAVEIWAGGSSLRSTRRSVEAVHFFHDLPSLRQAILIWRRAHGQSV